MKQAPGRAAGKQEQRSERGNSMKSWMPMAALVLALMAGCGGGGGGSDVPAGTAGSGTLGTSPSTTGTPAADAGTVPAATAVPSGAAGTASANAAAAPTVASVPEAPGGTGATAATPVSASSSATAAAVVPTVPATVTAPAAPTPPPTPPAIPAPTPTPAPSKASTTISAPVPTPYDLLVDQAEAKRKEVEALAVDGPCETDDQCGTLTLEPTYVGPIAMPQWLDYSLVSPTASAAFAAAAEFNQLALQAQAIAPPNNVICACSINGSLTVLRCVARKCVRTQSWGDPIVLPASEARPARNRR